MRKERHDQSDFGRGRWIALVFLTLAALFAVTVIGRGEITPWVTLGASIATLLVWPFLGIFVWKRASAQSAIAAMCLGFLAICIHRQRLQAKRGNASSRDSNGQRDPEQERFLSARYCENQHVIAEKLQLIAKTRKSFLPTKENSKKVH